MGTHEDVRSLVSWQLEHILRDFQDIEHLKILSQNKNAKNQDKIQIKVFEIKNIRFLTLWK